MRPSPRARTSTTSSPASPQSPPQAACTTTGARPLRARRAHALTTLLATAVVGGTASVGGSLLLTTADAPPAAGATVSGAAVSAEPNQPNASSTSASPADLAFDYFGGLNFDSSVPAPADVIGHRIGEHFTRYDHVVNYIEALAAATPRVTIEHYGETHQRRPLHILTITSRENHARLDTILERNRELTDPRETSASRAEAIARDNPAVVWLSYNVHGNEAACTEAALQVAYTLAAATNDEVERLLDDLVIVIDPCLNPDGRERYISFFDNHVGASPNPYANASEHREPWPSGRSNHYLFDLNRDWVWGVHPESSSRMAVYRRYMPQLHIDNHEQGIDSPYFFGAGDTPYNLNIPLESKRWFDLYGRANAEVFDRYGLPYATKERFDYLYPGYGKVTPVYHGAIGLLTEQAGHGRAGLAITVDDDHGPGLVLTLERRALNHFLTSMSYLETTAELRQEQLERFYNYFKNSLTTAPGETTAFIVDPSTDAAKLARLERLCRLHGIEIEQLERGITTEEVAGYHPPFQPGTAVEIPAGAWVIRAGQPMGLLARALLERDTGVEDIDTYDITSWTVPVMYGLTAWEYAGDLSGLPLRTLNDASDRATPVADNAATTGELPRVGIIVPADQFEYPQALAAATRHNLFARLTGDAITADQESQQTTPRGSLLVHTFRNDPDTLRAFIDEVDRLGLAVIRMETGYPASGPALGNNANRRFVVPRIIVARGTPISSLSFGHTWHLLDVQSPTPHATVNINDLGRVNWNEVNVLVLPSAWSLGNAVSSGTIEEIKSWVQRGGTVVAIGNAARWASSTLVGLEGDQNVEQPQTLEYVRTEHDASTGQAAGNTAQATGSGDPAHTQAITGDSTGNATDSAVRGGSRNGDAWRSKEARGLALDDDELKAFELTWDERDERSALERVPGAVLSAKVETTHPLAAGVDERLGFHVFSGSPLPISNTGYIIARFGHLDDQGGPRIGGWISERQLARLAGTPAVTHHRVGGGTVICFASDPTNRGMNQAGMRLLLNSILMGPSMSSSLQPLGAGEHDDFN